MALERCACGHPDEWHGNDLICAGCDVPGGRGRHAITRRPEAAYADGEYVETLRARCAALVEAVGALTTALRETFYAFDGNNRRHPYSCKECYMVDVSSEDIRHTGDCTYGLLLMGAR